MTPEAKIVQRVGNRVALEHDLPVDYAQSLVVFSLLCIGMQGLQQRDQMSPTAAAVVHKAVDFLMDKLQDAYEAKNRGLRSNLSGRLLGETITSALNEEMQHYHPDDERNQPCN